ncbi:MAG: hypothetical protein P4M14_04620 [Gammaproteobacteria bacterium]|nr:hypothetical protein [Gammaproteobacteria bacterium]
MALSSREDLGKAHERQGDHHFSMGYYALAYKAYQAASVLKLGKSAAIELKCGRAQHKLFQGCKYETNEKLKNSYAASEYFANTLEHYNSALSQSPDFACARLNLGILWKENDEIDQAIFQVRLAIKLYLKVAKDGVSEDQYQPRLAEAYYTLATLLQEKGAIKEIVAYLDKAVKLNPLLAKAFCMRAKFKANALDIVAAKADINQVDELLKTSCIKPNAFLLVELQEIKSLVEKMPVSQAISIYSVPSLTVFSSGALMQQVPVVMEGKQSSQAAASMIPALKK